MIPDNSWYGHDEVLARYCRVRRPPPIFGSIVHGWRLDYDVGDERRLNAAPVFAWSERHRLAATNRGVPNVVAIGAPFVYLAAMLQASAAPPVGAGTLCFPLHSAERAVVQQDHRRLIDEVEADEPGPYTVSLFYQDIARPGLRETYEAAGWRVVSFGTRADPLFLWRLHEELVAHRSVVADQLGSSLWYAGHLGRRIRVLGAPPSMVGVDPSTARAAYESRWPAIHGGGVSGPDATAVADEELGTGSMRPPAELARLLGWMGPRRFAARALRPLFDRRAGAGVRAGEPGRD